MNVLNVFTTAPLDVAGMFPGATIDAMSVGALSKEKPMEQYDIVIAPYSLNAVEPEEVPTTVKRLSDAAKVGGEVIIITPSLEWAMRETRVDNPSPALHSALFGTKEAPNRCGFTLAWLRALMADAGLVSRKAIHNTYTIEMNKNQKLPVLENRVIGLKVQSDNPSGAIS